jgi:hypothetical protein
MWSYLKIPLYLAVGAGLPLSCSSGANCDAYADCVIQIKISPASVEQFIGGTVTANISNSSDKNKIPTFLLQQAGKPDLPLVPLNQANPFQFSLTCAALAGFAPGPAKIAVQESTTAGLAMGAGAIDLIHIKPLYNKAPDISIPPANGDTSRAYGQLIDVAFLDFAKTIVTLQEGKPQNIFERRLVYYNFDPTAMPSLIANLGAASTLRDPLYGQTALFSIKGNNILLAQPFTPKLQLNEFPNITSITNQPTANYPFGGMTPMGNDLLSSADGLSIDTTGEYAIAYTPTSPDKFQLYDLISQRATNPPHLGVTSFVVGAAGAAGPLLTLADLDQDGHADLVYASADGKNIGVAKNDGKNHFAADPDLTMLLAKTIKPLGIDAKPISLLRSGDIDGIYGDDLVIGQGNSLSFLQIYPSKCLALTANSISAPSPVLAAAVGQVDGQDAPDIIAISGPTSANPGQASTITVYFGKLQ